MDPMLEYLLEFNKTNSMEYKGRYLVPPGGLAEMLKNYKGFHLNREEVVKEEISLEPELTTQDELYALLD